MSIPARRSLAQLLEPTEVAALMYVDLATVARWTEGRRLIAVDGADGRRRYARDEVLRLMVDIKRTRKGAAARVPLALSLQVPGPERRPRLRPARTLRSGRGPGRPASP